ncbi:fibroblast growth factor 23 [Cololabis saira]|uniref:fibroblast growth factor 23 n=1 Tax=Cololabis saira TaxID=129043 RepID=UPI002AD417ED|nr:fibroblast growth factor 23 [Cololabis saira]
MRRLFLSVILIAAHVSVTVDCRPGLQHPRLQRHEKETSDPGAHGETSADAGRLHLQLHGSMRKGNHRVLLVSLPVRTTSSNVVPVFYLRRRRFLCLDVRGKLSKSRQKYREDCLFQRIKLDLANHRDVFYSLNGNQQLSLGGDDLQAVHREPPGVSSALLQRFLDPLLKRQRRSEAVNPSDPLRAQSHPSHSVRDANHGLTEPEQTGAVSKETITSCDDPLRVLRPNRHGSPVKTNIVDRAEHE